MCGRFALGAAPESLAALFELEAGALPEGLRPRYNIAPTQPVLAARWLVPDGEPGGRALGWLRWGLVPSWAKEFAIGARLINARAETAAAKPAFRSALRRRRCLVAADGFYEWQRRGRGRKQPYLIRLRDGRPFAFAGLWERWRSPEGLLVESCTLLTTEPNAVCAPIHDRMPVILERRDFARWLDPAEGDPERIRSLLLPFPAEAMSAHPVGPLVNDARIDRPECAAPALELPV